METNDHRRAIQSTQYPHPIKQLVCQYCAFSVNVSYFRRSRDRSRLSRNNRGRTVMVKNLHQRHRDELGSAER